MNHNGVCEAPRVFFCPSLDGNAMHKFQFAQWMMNVALWKLENDINKAPMGKISSFALLSSNKWIKINADPVSFRVQTITKEAPLAPVDWTSQLFLVALGVQQTGDIHADIYAGPEYESLVADLKKQAQASVASKDVPF